MKGAKMLQMGASIPGPTLGAFVGVRDSLAKFKQLALEAVATGDWDCRCHAALNGEASQAVRSAASLDVRRQFGAFFTGVDLSERLMSKSKTLPQGKLLYDPTCGMGDLLLAAAKRLPRQCTLPQTLHFWGERLAGTDLHPEFIEGAKTRLVLLARQMHGGEAIRDADPADYFPHLRVGNAMDEHALFARATHLLMNPPYGKTPSPAGCKWAGGQITEAATFMMTALERVSGGAEILAILPDVLRSGSFCEAWRDAVSNLAGVAAVETYGIFDEYADVDVFLLRLLRRKRKCQRQARWPLPNPVVAHSVGDLFEVNVGRVVPHRDEEVGRNRLYLHPRGVPAWGVMTEIQEKRRFRGKVFCPPFVVIRRTSRPGHPHRATATIVNTSRPVAVENHLIVCTPKEGGLRSCRSLMKQLKTEAVNVFLDKQIRCRHLTVPAVQALPWPPP